MRTAGFYSLPISGGYDYGYAPPNVVVIQQPPPYVVIEPPAAPQPPVVSAILEYKVAEAPAVVSEPASFGIVLKDGSSRDAIAVTVQDNVVHYVDADGRHERVALDTVDRDATRRLNRERKLDLRLP
jgi:hypothetical protein